MKKPVVLVLASGRGERFVASGGRGSKLNALLAGKTVLGRTLDAVKASGLPWHVEADGHAGMGDSIAAAVRATLDSPGWLVLPGDLPLVQPRSLTAVAAAMSAHRLVFPSYDGQRGHPVGFAQDCRELLLALTGPGGANPVVRALLKTGEARELALDDPGVVTDIDTLQDLQAAERLL